MCKCTCFSFGLCPVFHAVLIPYKYLDFDLYSLKCKHQKALSIPSDHMKHIPIEKYEIVHSGQSWQYDEKPCHKHMLTFLEKNESVVTWLRPKGCAHSIDMQVPCIRVNDKYYSISLRMMKAIWRHVRLVKGFVNHDTAKDGSMILRIPLALYHEKQRTQMRFNVSLMHICEGHAYVSLYMFVRGPM